MKLAGERAEQVERVLRSHAYMTVEDSPSVVNDERTLVMTNPHIATAAWMAGFQLAMGLTELGAKVRAVVENHVLYFVAEWD